MGVDIPSSWHGQGCFLIKQYTLLPYSEYGLYTYKPKNVVIFEPTFLRKKGEKYNTIHDFGQVNTSLLRLNIGLIVGKIFLNVEK